MIINPQYAIDQGWVTGIAEPKKQIQPNAIEFTLDSVFKINKDATFTINRDGKTHRGVTPLEPQQYPVDSRMYWYLQAESVYDATSNVCVDLPDDVAVKLIVRSTYSRNGIFLTSGLYDSGYTGPIGFAIHNKLGLARIEIGERFGQAIFETADSQGKYAGGYNHEAGSHWADKK